MALSYRERKNGIPIAKVKDSNKIIYLFPESKVFSEIPSKNVKESTYKCPYCKMKITTKQNYTHHIKFVCKKKKQHTEMFTNIIVDENVTKLPQVDEGDHEILFVTGPPKSGKSYFINEQVKIYKKLNPDNDVILFTRLTSDDTLDEGLYTRVVISPEMLKNPYKLEELANSLLIFDDIETSEYKKVSDYIFSLLNDVIKNGRHEHISVIVSNQETCMGAKTKTILANMSGLVIFPRSGSVYSMTRVLKVYMGLSPYQINRVLNLPSRWVYLNRQYPQHVIYEHGVYMTKSDI